MTATFSPEERATLNGHSSDVKRYRAACLTLLKIHIDGQEPDTTRQPGAFFWPPHVVAEVRRMCGIVGIEPFDPAP